MRYPFVQILFLTIFTVLKNYHGNDWLIHVGLITILLLRVGRLVGIEPVPFPWFFELTLYSKALLKQAGPFPAI